MSHAPVICRYAPAPTGYLHLGHVLNAVYVWGVTRAARGRVLLRIEDHDRQRSRSAFERAILDDLDWLGFVPDEPSTTAFRQGVCHGRQSDRGAVYEAALAGLRTRGLVYACECSRSVLAQGTGTGGERRYPGICRAKRLPEGPRLATRVHLAASSEHFDDLLLGPQEQRPDQQCGDLVARDREGNWTYQFAAAVDDFEQGVSLVIRGQDLLASTGRQMQLARLLGRPQPAMVLHHPLIMKTPTQKLSKADGDAGIRDLRRRGVAPERVIGEAAARGGLIDGLRRVSAADAPELVQERMPEVFARLARGEVSATAR